MLTYASADVSTVGPMDKIDLKGGVGCIVTDDMLGNTAADGPEDEDKQTRNGYMDNPTGNQGSTVAWTALTPEEGEEAAEWDTCLPRFCLLYTSCDHAV